VRAREEEDSPEADGVSRLSFPHGMWEVDGLSLSLEGWEGRCPLKPGEIINDNAADLLALISA